MKTDWIVLGGVGLVLVIAFYGSAWKNDGAVNRALMKAAGQMNANLPMMIDSETRWDSTVGADKTLLHHYTLVNSPASAVSADDIKNGQQKIVNSVCTSTVTQVFVKNGVTVSYAFYGNDGKQITVISVAPSQCDGT